MQFIPQVLNRTYTPYFTNAQSLTMTKHTRSVSFAPTSQLILFRSDGKIDTERTWNSQEEEEQFKIKMVEDVNRLREAIIAPSQPPHLSKDDLVDCNGIEVHVLYSEEIRQRLHALKCAHKRIVLVAQHLFSPLEFSQVLQQGSDHARQHALALAAL